MELRPLNNRDFIILAVLCIITISIALYDFYTLRDARYECLDKCNEHWAKEFETKCMGIYGQPEMTQTLLYNISFP